MRTESRKVAMWWQPAGFGGDLESLIYLTGVVVIARLQGARLAAQGCDSRNGGLGR